MIYVAIGIAFVVILMLATKKVKEARARAAAEAEKKRNESRARELARIREEEEKAAAERIAQERQRIEDETLAAIAKVPGSEQYRVDTQQTYVSVHLMTITEFTPISKKRFVAFDLETTGLSQDSSIVEIGAVRVENGVITEEFQQLIDPGFHIPYEASAVNHITDDMVAGMPKIYEVLPAFLSFVGDDVLVAHNAAFDIRILSNVCMQNRFKVPEDAFDTMSLARYYPEAVNKKLGTLAKAAGIVNPAAHRALGDAQTAALLVVATNEKRGKKK